jgi:peptide/nickel transport system substrate-binding protein
MSSFPTNLDPRIGLDAASEDFHHLIFNGLLRKDASGRMVPDLCSRFEKVTPTRYRFYLRPNVYFHNGKACTSRDVVYTYKTVLDGAIVTTKKATLGTVTAVRAVGENIVDIELSEPFNGLLVNLNLGIIPYGSSNSFASHPIGTGPYALKSYIQDQEAVLEANPKYFEGAARIRYLRIRMIPDAVTRALELRKGSIDLVMGPAIVPPDQYLVLKQDSSLQTALCPGNNYAYLGINLKDPVLRNVKVRQAIASCINRKAIIEHLYHGAATEATGLLAPYNWGYEKDVSRFPYDPERAKQLLDEAGYKDPDGSGPRKRFELTFKTSTNEFRRTLATVFQNDLDRVGIGLQVRAYEFGTFFSDINHGNFQLFMLMWIGESDPDLYRNIFASDGTRNRGKYSDADVDLWLEKARTAQTDEEQLNFYSLVQIKVAYDCPYISLWHESNIAVFRKGLAGFALTPDADIRVLKNVYWN